MSLLTSLFRIIPPSFRTGYCPPSLQQFANDLLNGAQITFLIQQGNFLYNYGSATPAPENRIFAWLNTPSSRWYTFQFGVWTSPMDPASREPTFRKMWKPASGTLESALWALDGGDGADPAVSPPTITTGASWVVDHDFDGVFPIGVGNVPGTAPPVPIGVDVTGGEYQHVLTQAELPNINLPLAVKAGQVSGLDADTSEVLANPNTALNALTLQVPLGGSATPITNMPPYRSVYWIKPTARTFYVLPA